MILKRGCRVEYEGANCTYARPSSVFPITHKTRPRARTKAPIQIEGIFDTEVLMIFELKPHVINP